MATHDTSGRARSLDEVDLVVDTDAHVTESVEDLLPYMEDRYEGLRRIVEDAAHPEHDVYSVAHPLPPFIHEDGSRLIVDVEGQEIAVFRIDGEYHALPNFCPHQAAPLCEGDLTGRMVVGDDGWEWVYTQEGEVITCPWHGWKFDVTSGKNIKDESVAVPTYEVEVEDGDVYVVR